MTDLSGQVAVVTAAAQGIGRASAEALARAGAKVIATDINEAGLAGIEGCETAKLDVLSEDAVTAFCKEVGTVDILFNCAGIVHGGNVLQASEDDFDFAYALNVKAMARMVRGVLPGMLEQERGAIINVSSVASSIKGVPDRCVYGVTKAAVIGLTKSIAADYVTKGIRCNAICPGTVQSPSLDDRLAATGDYDKARAAFIARQPMGRVGEAEEIADLVVHLAGATYTTGQAIAIDGGWTI